MHLRFIDIDNNTIGTLGVRDGRIVATGIGYEAACLNVREPGTHRKLTAADGDTWLHWMRLEFRSGYVRTFEEPDD